MSSALSSSRCLKFFAYGLCFSLLAGAALSPVAGQAADEKKVDIAAMKAKYKRPDSIPYPKDNAFSESKALLGKTLYFDPRLSSSGTQSCATCHNPSFSWEDGMALGVGHGHKRLGRSTPTILNLAWDEAFFWDGRADTLEQQALGPIQAAGEMNMAMDHLLGIVSSIEGYKPMFDAAFPNSEKKGEVTPEKIGQAIATFERTVVSAEAPFDKWINGDEKAISQEAKNGFVLFNEKANCAACHSGWNFSDGSFHDIGLPSEDLGRGKLVDLPAMKHAFKTMGLRNIEERKPYMHDGSLASLEAVIDHYDHGFIKRESLSGDMKPLNLTDTEKAELKAFLLTLSSVDAPVTIPTLPR